LAPACLSRFKSVIHGPQNTPDHHYPIGQAQEADRVSQPKPYRAVEPAIRSTILTYDSQPLPLLQPRCRFANAFVQTDAIVLAVEPPQSGMRLPANDFRLEHP
jgi:hypothetical protein